MKIPGYDVVDEIASGGFGTVYLAHRIADNRQVAVKVLQLPNDANLQRFYREAKLLHRELENPHVVDLLDWDLGHSPPYIVMEYCSGGSLQAWVERRRPWKDVVVALSHASEGLRGIHARNGWHRDIKPRNLLLALPNGNRGVVKVGDFGLARVPTASSGPMTRSPHGTDGYIAPEVPLTGHSLAADVYSLGITGIELHTGQRDPAGLTNDAGPKALRDFLRQMVDPVPGRRPTMEACASRFKEPFEAPVTAPKVQPAAQPSQPAAPAAAKRGGRRWVAAGLTLLTAAAVAAVTANKKDANGRFHGSDGKFRGGRWG